MLIKIIAISLIISLLSGCSLWGGREYIRVQPHDEGYEVAVDSNAITISSYLGLKNAILGFVEEGVEDGVIRAEAYPGEITEDLDDAVYEVWRSDPIGAYAVDYMTYDCSKIVNQYEIHIHTTYRRSVEEIESIGYASDMDTVRVRLADAMEEYQSILTLRVGDYQEFDIEAVLADIYIENPEFAVEHPNVSLTTYPENGSQRILEISFAYSLDQETLMECRSDAEEILSLISKLYGSNNDDVFCARRLYDRVRRDGVLLNQQQSDSIYADSVYGALVEDSATSLGYAQAYLLLLDSKDISGSLVESTYMGQKHYICRLILEDEVYYADPSPSVVQSDYDSFMMTEEALSAYGYEVK